MVQPFYSGVLMGRKVATRRGVILHDLHLFSKQLSLDIPLQGGCLPLKPANQKKPTTSVSWRLGGIVYRKGTG